MARRHAQSPLHSTARRVETDSDEKAAKTESQQMLAISHLLKKPKGDDKEVHQFGTTIKTDQKKLKALLTQRLLQAQKEEKRRRDELASTILQALQTPNRSVKGETPTFAGTHIAGNAVYSPVTSILSASEGLVEEYQRLNGMIANLRDEQPDPIADTWKQNVEETDRQLKTGARVALRNVKKVLGADVDNDGLGVMDEDGDVDMEGEGKKVELNYELQKSLRYAERGIKRMVKGLPMDESF